jgi:CubicO group peptidase (beta-lactamase class C family)
VSGNRALPEQASLRYLKMEAKRRRTAGEFATLHLAQLAIAREHGQPSWTALRATIDAADAAAGREGHALTQLRWIAGRFSGALDPGWAAPGEDELREHFSARFLAAVPPERLIATITEIAPVLRADLADLAVTIDRPFLAQGRVAGHLVTAETEARPPYRLTGVRVRRLGERISDERAVAPATATCGAVPATVTGLAEAATARLGLVGLALAGASASEPAWATATGWASLERAEPLGTGHAFPAYQVTMTVTAVAVLCLAAAGRLRLDAPANSYLATVRLSDDAATVRELLTHTAGVADPAEITAPDVPPLAAVTEIIAALTGLPYQEAVTRLVLRPLGMSRSRFPASAPGGPVAGLPAEADSPAVTGYDVAADATFTPLDPVTCVFPAAGGLCTTAADLARLGLGWSSLLPRSLAAQALRPHVRLPNGVQVGLGWMMNEPAGLAGLGGDGPGTAASLLVSLDGRHACAALANRQIFVEHVNNSVIQVLTGEACG